MQKGQLLKIAKMNPQIFWDVKDIDQLSENALLERIINYGNFQQFKQVFEKCEVEILQGQLNSLINKTRSNLRPSAANLANIYLERKIHG